MTQQSNSKKVVISITSDAVRFFLTQQNNQQTIIIDSFSDSYQSFEQLSQLCHNWVDRCKAKNLECHWLLSRNLYKTITVKQPETEDSEIDSSIKWLVKDQLEQTLDELIICHYKPNNISDKTITAVIAERELIENLIKISNDYHLNLINIAVDELSSGNAIRHLLTTNSIIGLIDQDPQGLIFNFYYNQKLSFTRHIKGRFFPKKNNDNEFILETENDTNQTNQFILETQRTLDYCVSQIFRQPVDFLIIDNKQNNNSPIIKEIENITELPVVSFKHQYHNDNQENLPLTISELGLIVQHDIPFEQQINFYLNKYKPKPLEFSFKYAAIILILFMLGFTASGILLEKQNNDLTRDKNQLAIQLKRTQTSIENTHRNTLLFGEIDFEKTVNNKKLTLLSYQKLLSQVTQINKVKHQPYSSVLNELSKQQEKHLWLTSIALKPDNISLQGKTTQAETIPSYLEKLSKSPLLNSKFKDFFIERDITDNRVINFSMSNGLYNHVE